MQSLDINVLELLHNSIKTEFEEAKQKELTSWIQVDVYAYNIVSSCPPWGFSVFSNLVGELDDAGQFFL